jgi:cobalt-precorrin-7 (C5)-methyltransferase
VVSGDSGFYSLTNYLKKHFKDEDLDIYPGISSLQYFFARIGKTWEDAKLMSMHGREEDLIRLVKSNKKVGILTDDIWTPDEIAKKLIKHGVKEKKIYVGENLSYYNEKINELTLKESAETIFDKLNVVVVSDE